MLKQTVASDSHTSTPGNIKSGGKYDEYHESNSQRTRSQATRLVAGGHCDSLSL